VLPAALAVTALLVTACAAPATQSPAAPAPAPAGALNAGQTLGAIPPVPAGWKRPTDVAPAPEQGKFKIISQEPAPGDKVRVFFLGAQF
jgi:hypothetical protein